MTETGQPPRRKRQIRIGPLQTLGQVAGELGRLYREARRGEIDVGDASRLANVLAVLRGCLADEMLERRVSELEAAIIRDASVPNYGHALQ